MLDRPRPPDNRCRRYRRLDAGRISPIVPDIGADEISQLIATRWLAEADAG